MAAQDAGGSGGTCRGADECTGAESCVGPNDVVCGIPPQEQCQTDQDCPAGDVCHAIGDTCSPDGVGSRCGAPCIADDGSCGQDFQCGPQGACMPIPCDDAGFACRPSETCDPSSIDTNAPVHGITHGCAIIPCKGDTACPDQTVCVNGYCQDGLGSCALPAP